MHYATVFLLATLAMAVHGRPSARTFGLSQHPAHHHDAHNHNAFAGAQHDTANHGVQAGGDSSVSMLVCQVVKVPVGQSGAQPSHAPTGVGSTSVVASPVASSPQENASLWLNRTSQLHLNQSHQHPALHHVHQHQHAGMVNHAHAAHNHHEHPGMVNHAHNHIEHQHQHTQHGGQANHHGAQGQVHNHPVNPTHAHQLPQAVPNQAVPMTVVSVPVLVPAVHAGSVPHVNLSTGVPASVNAPSLHFSHPGQDNATTSVTADPVNATLQSTSMPADANLLGRTGALPTAPVTEVTPTQVTDASTLSTLSSIFTIWFRSGTVDVSTEATSTSEPSTSSRGPIFTTPTSTDASTTGHKPPTTDRPVTIDHSLMNSYCAISFGGVASR
ncbi:hypothetical protein MTO96_010921 [Rhipicephalus appendiculatus]